MHDGALARVLSPIPEATMRTHECVNGRSIEYAPTAAEATFLERVAAAVGNKRVTADELRALVYGPDNPMLAERHGYTFVTPDAFESPVFRVLLDLLDRKRVATGALDLDKAAALYTMSVAQAADHLGIATSAVRTAVLAGRLPAWMRDGEIRLDPRTVEAYEVRAGGRKPRLLVTCGSVDGTSMRVHVAGGELEVTDKRGGIIDGQVTRWTALDVFTGAKRDGETSYRYWRIAPGGNANRVELVPFKVAGRFTIEAQRSGKAASEAWHAATRTSP